MSRPVPNINAARLTTVPTPVFTATEVVQTAQYRVCWATIVKDASGNPIASFSDAPTAPPFQQGSGTVTVTVPNTSGALSVQQAIIGEIAAAEGLTTGDYIISPDGKTITTL